MRFLEAWVATPLAQALGWTLLHSLWEGAIVSACLGAALWALRSARARYATACVAMLVMLGGISLTFIRMMPERVHGLPGVETTALPPWNVPPELDAAGASGSRLALVVPWLAPFWIAGVWILALGQVGGWIWVSRLRRRGVCCAPEHWQKEIERLSARLRMSKPVQILESCLADVPIVVGHIRPVILMPIGLLAGLPPGQIEAILLHELAHIRRYDYLVNVLQRAVECLLFYHPAAWWISRVLRAERENCCDDVVVGTSGDAQQYAVALTTLAQIRWSARTPAIAATGGSLVKRIRRLLYPKGANGVWTPFFAAAIVVTTAVVTLAAWPAKPPQQNPAATQRQKGRAETSSYDKWLSEEVVYIIADQERAAFQKLTTDEERNKFIEQFWERRNPHPGSPENKFREEYYRRIAYANKHWATDRPGWKTDRGHMYIMYGPPDEIDAHPSGSPYPIEEWRYKYIKGLGSNVVFKFIDPTKTGKYQLASPPWKR
jgi:GWxTD domain-containing protein